jgi:hypothetical protein
MIMLNDIFAKVKTCGFISYFKIFRIPSYKNRKMLKKHIVQKDVLEKEFPYCYQNSNTCHPLWPSKFVAQLVVL